MRANAGDLGTRPVNGPFWESPDIFILAGVDPAAAPAVPAQLGQVGLAGQPNTLYAHVWNLGNASADVVLVEFYWCDPALGINAASTHLIAQTTTSLGPKGSANSHAVVKCPVAWVPTYLNGGHECLLVRVWDDPADLPGLPLLDASWNRHVAQRNIHVAAPGGAMRLAMPGGGVPAPGPGPDEADPGPTSARSTAGRQWSRSSGSRRTRCPGFSCTRCSAGCSPQRRRRRGVRRCRLPARSVEARRSVAPTRCSYRT